MRITWALFKVELLKLIKTPIIIIFGIAAPIFFMVIQSSMFTSDVEFMNQQVKMLDISLPMCTLMSIAVLGIGNVGVGLSHTRTVYFLKRLKATPTKKIHYIAANFLVQLLVLVLTIGILCTIASLKFGVNLMAHHLAKFIGVLVVSFLMCYFIGMFIGSVCEDPRSSQSVSMFVYFVCIFLGGFTFPIEFMPDGIKTVAYVIPTTHAVKIVQRVWNGLSIYDSYHMYVVLGFTLLFGLLTIKFFKYE